MNKTGASIVSFVLGAGIGVGATYIYIKRKYERVVQDEIASLKEQYREDEPQEEVKEDNVDMKRQEAEKARTKPDITEYAKTLKDNGYHRDYSDVAKNKYIRNIDYIPYEKLGEISEYDHVTLTYYSDDVLTDEADDIIDNYYDIVGDFVSHFGEFEDDSVFVQNDDREVYYEILRDNRRFRDVVEE